jgi:hypothetical protein
LCRDIVSDEIVIKVLNEPDVCPLVPGLYQNDSNIRVISSEMDEIQPGVGGGLAR